MKKIGMIWLALAFVVAMAAQTTYGAGLQQAEAHSGEAAKALEWMKTQQQPDGSFAGFGAGSTVDAVLAIVAAGGDIASYTKDGQTPIHFLESKAADLAKTPGGAGKLLIAVSALGRDGTLFGGTNLIDAINSTYDASSGHYGPDAIGHAFAMLGLKAAGQALPSKAMDYLKGIQTPEGGWAFTGDTKAGGADTNTTAVAVQALVAAGVSAMDPVMSKAKAYFMSQLNASDGGFPYQQGGEFGSASDVNSTAYVVQALHYLGENRGLDFIISMLKPNGAFRWMVSEQDDNAGATYQAIPAILGATLVEPKGASGAYVVTPTGMPSTGNSELPTVPLGIAALALLALGMGARLRHKLAV